MVLWIQKICPHDQLLFKIGQTEAGIHEEIVSAFLCNCDYYVQTKYDFLNESFEVIFEPVRVFGRFYISISLSLSLYKRSFSDVAISESSCPRLIQ